MQKIIFLKITLKVVLIIKCRALRDDIQLVFNGGSLQGGNSDYLTLG